MLYHCDVALLVELLKNGLFFLLVQLLFELLELLHHELILALHHLQLLFQVFVLANLGEVALVSFSEVADDFFVLLPHVFKLLSPLS